MASPSFFNRTLGITLAACTVMVAGAIGVTRGDAAQGKAIVRGNVPGEWRYWGADAWSTRYSALDQINARNFDSLQVAWTWKAGDFGEDEYYRTTPLFANGRVLTVATTRRYPIAIDPSNGQTLWSFKFDEGIRWQKAPRQFAGRGLSYWTDGTKERVLVVTPGYHLYSIDAATGKPDPAFGKNGVVDLEEGLGFPLVPLAVDDSGPLIISDAAPVLVTGSHFSPTVRWGSIPRMARSPTVHRGSSSEMSSSSATRPFTATIRSSCTICPATCAVSISAPESSSGSST